jgi:hypothetical protein
MRSLAWLALLSFGCTPPQETPAEKGKPTFTTPEVKPVAPRQLLSETGLQLLWPTVGDWIFVANEQNPSVRALSADGGAPHPVAGPIDAFTSWRDVFLAWEPAAAGVNGKALVAWTPTRGARRLSASTSPNDGYLPGVAVSSDGRWVAWLDKPASDGATADLVTARVDGAMPTRAFQGVHFATKGLSTAFAPCGGSRFCVVHAAAGDTTATFSVVDASSGAIHDVQTGVTSGVDVAGAVALVAGPAGQWLFPTDGHAAVEVPDLDETAVFFVSAAGDAAFYRATNGDLRRIDLQPGAKPVTLQTGVRFLLALVSDGNRLVYCTPTALLVTPLDPGGAATLLDPHFGDLGSSRWTPSGIAFTPDGQSVLWIDSVQRLNLSALDGSGARTLLTDADGFLPLADGLLLAAQQENGSGSPLDLLFVDPASGNTATIALGAQLPVATQHRLAWLDGSYGKIGLWDLRY